MPRFLMVRKLSSTKINFFIIFVPKGRDGCFFIVLALLFLLPIASANATNRFPQPQGAVNDFASVIPADVKKIMEDLAVDLLQKTGTTVVVATVKTVGDSDPDAYANELYENWGIGKKGEDKGVLIFFALLERGVRIETGYGVEGILPDGLVGRILDEYVVPYIKQSDYGMGLLNGMLAVGQIIAKDAGITLGKGYVPVKTKNQRGKGTASGLLPIIVFIILLFLISRRRSGVVPFLIFLGMSGRDGGYGGGSGFSGGFGGFGGGLSGGGGASRGF